MTSELKFTIAELAEYASQVFPQADRYEFEIVDLKPGMIRIDFPTSERDLRPGGTVSGPSMFALADIAAYFLTLAYIGKEALAVTTNLNINFVSKPQGDLYAIGKILKIGKRLSVTEISIFTKNEDELVAHATATYSIPPSR